MVSEKIKDFTQKIISCCKLEEENFRFYHNVAKKMEPLELRSQIIGIGYDSLKHSMTMKEIIKKIPKIELTPKDQPKAISELLEEVTEVSNQIHDLPYLSNREFLDVFKASTELEDRLAEIYLELFKPKILRIASYELDPKNPVSLKNLSKIFEDIVREKQSHREVLFDVGYCFASKEQQMVDNTPVVRYTNPDRWTPPQA